MRQLRYMEEQIREESLSEEKRVWCQLYRTRQAVIRHQAQRRLGLPQVQWFMRIDPE
jgi:hypothetical protein